MVGALLLRVAIPAGYMPASIASDGWYLQWCPNGVSAEVMTALFEAAGSTESFQGAHQHQHHHGHAQPAAEEADTPPSGATHCDFGILSADAHGAPQSAPPPALTPPAELAALPGKSIVPTRPRTTYLARAPPRHRYLPS